MTTEATRGHDTIGDPDGEQGALGELFDASPEVPARTTVPATLGLFAGVVALLASPWSLMAGACVVLAVVGLVLSVVGLAKASRPGTAGGGSAAAGVVLALAVAVLLGLRYASIDTAVADGISLRPALEWLTALLPPV